MSGVIVAFAISMEDVAVSIMLTDAKTYTLPIVLIGGMHANFDLSIGATSVILAPMTVLLIVIHEKLFGPDRAIGQAVFR